jgi:hypothetical protein
MALTGSFFGPFGLTSIDCIFEALEKITPARRRNMTESNREIIMKGHAFVAHT